MSLSCWGRSRMERYPSRSAHSVCHTFVVSKGMLGALEYPCAVTRPRVSSAPEDSIPSSLSRCSSQPDPSQQAIRVFSPEFWSVGYRILRKDAACRPLERMDAYGSLNLLLARLSCECMMENKREIWLIQKANVVDINAFCFVKLQILHKIVGVCLTPITRSAVESRDAAWVATVAVIQVILHEARRTPCIGVDLLYPSCQCVPRGEPGLSGSIVFMRSYGLESDEPIPLRKIVKPAPFSFEYKRSRTRFVFASLKPSAP